MITGAQQDSFQLRRCWETHRWKIGAVGVGGVFQTRRARRLKSAITWEFASEGVCRSNWRVANSPAASVFYISLCGLRGRCSNWAGVKKKCFTAHIVAFKLLKIKRGGLAIRQKPREWVSASHTESTTPSCSSRRWDESGTRLSRFNALQFSNIFYPLPFNHRHAIKSKLAVSS